MTVWSAPRRSEFLQPEVVAGTWKAARGHADDIAGADARAALQQFDPLWDDVFAVEQAHRARCW